MGASQVAEGFDCSCHRIREGSGGVTYSYAILGVECPACEARGWEYEQEAAWEAMSEAERCSVRWRVAVSGLPDRRPGAPASDAPF